MEVNTKVKAGFSNKLFALNVVITIPVPDTTAHADMQTSIGESPLGTFRITMHLTSDTTRPSGAGGAIPCMRRVETRLKQAHALQRGP